LEVKPRKHYIAFIASHNVVDVQIQRNGLKLWLNLPQGQLDDPKGICRDVSSLGHLGNGDYQIQMLTDDHLEYILSLIKQSFQVNKK